YSRLYELPIGLLEAWRNHALAMSPPPATIPADPYNVDPWATVTDCSAPAQWWNNWDVSLTVNSPEIKLIDYLVDGSDFGATDESQEDGVFPDCLFFTTDFII